MSMSLRDLDRAIDPETEFDQQLQYSCGCAF